jgi:hypothetical protein
MSARLAGFGLLHPHLDFGLTGSLELQGQFEPISLLEWLGEVEQHQVVPLAMA